MRTLTSLKLLTWLLGAITLVKAYGQQNNAQLSATDATVLQVSTQLVIVDVVMQSKNGHPVHGLKEEMFHLTEDGVPQRISHFDRTL